MNLSELLLTTFFFLGSINYLLKIIETLKFIARRESSDLNMALSLFSLLPLMTSLNGLKSEVKKEEQK